MLLFCLMESCCTSSTWERATKWELYQQDGCQYRMANEEKVLCICYTGAADYTTVKSGTKSYPKILKDQLSSMGTLARSILAETLDGIEILARSHLYLMGIWEKLSVAVHDSHWQKGLSVTVQALHYAPCSDTKNFLNNSKLSCVSQDFRWSTARHYASKKI